MTTTTTTKATKATKATPKADVIADQAAKAEAAKSLGLTLEQAELLAANPDKALEVMAEIKAAAVATLQLSPGHLVDTTNAYQRTLADAARVYGAGQAMTYTYYVYVVLSAMNVGLLYKGDDGKSERWAKGTLSTLADMAKVHLVEVLGDDAPRDVLGYLSKTAASLAATDDGKGYMTKAAAKGYQADSDLWDDARAWVSQHGNPVTLSAKAPAKSADTLAKLVTNCQVRIEALGVPMADLVRALLDTMDDEAKVGLLGDAEAE